MKIIDELHSDERLQNPEAVFKTHVFYPIVSTAIGQLQSRFEGQRIGSALWSDRFFLPTIAAAIIW